MEVYVRKRRSGPPFEVIAALVAGIAIGFAASYFLFGGRPAPAPTEETPIAALPPTAAEPESPPSEEPAAPAPEPQPSAPAEDQPPAAPAPAPSADLATLEDVWPARHLFIAVQGKKLDNAAKEMLAELKPGGVVLRGDNFKERTQLVDLIAEIKAAVGLGTTIDALPLIAVAQEGGALNVLNLKEAPSAAKIGAAKDLVAARAAGVALGQSLVDRGIAVLLAPVLDLASKAAPKEMQARCFGEDHLEVAALGLAYADGAVSAGVLPVAKHFPGMGTLKGDTQKTLATLADDQDGVSKIIYPFNEAARCNVPGILVGHVVVPSVDGDTKPLAAASMSPKFLKGLLREKWGYPGVLLADDLNKGAISKTVPVEKAAVAALAAGNDAVLMLNADVEKVRLVCATIEKAAVDSALDRAALSESKKRLDGWQQALKTPRPGLDGPLPPLPKPEPPASPETPPVAAAPVAAAPAPAPQEQAAPAQPAPVEPGAVEPPSEEPSVQPPANTKAIEYVVKGGDFLSSIATRHKVTHQEIMTWNHLNDTKLNVGQKLTIYVAPDFVPPDAAAPAPAETPKAEAAPTAPPVAKTPKPSDKPADAVDAAPSGGDAVVYTVKKGDNLANIASKYGVTADDVRGWNKIEGNRIDVGQQLTVHPKKAPAE